MECKAGQLAIRQHPSILGLLPTCWFVQQYCPSSTCWSAGNSSILKDVQNGNVSLQRISVWRCWNSAMLNFVRWRQADWRIESVSISSGIVSKACSFETIHSEEELLGWFWYGTWLLSWIYLLRKQVVGAINSTTFANASLVTWSPFDVSNGTSNEWYYKKFNKIWITYSQSMLYQNMQRFLVVHLILEVLVNLF